jgi:hypothetical protein
VLLSVTKDEYIGIFPGRWTKNSMNITAFAAKKNTFSEDGSNVHDG